MLLGASQLALVEKSLRARGGDIGDTGSIPGLGSSPGGGNGNPLQYSPLENPMDRGAWQATVHGVEKSQTRLKRLRPGACCFTVLPDKTRCPRKEPSYPISNPCLNMFTG